MQSGANSPYQSIVANENRSIAVIDDDPAVRCAVGRLLEAMDFRVSAFGSAEEFLDYNWSGRFDCILLDIHLTGISGFDLHARLTAAGSRIPVIFISNNADSARAASLASVGVEALCKPVDADVLLGAIARSVRRRNRS